MRSDSPSSPDQTPPSSDAEDYPVWKRWGDIDEHNKSRSSEQKTSKPDGKDPAWERLKAQLRDAERSAGPSRKRPQQEEVEDADEPPVNGIASNGDASAELGLPEAERSHPEPAAEASHIALAHRSRDDAASAEVEPLVDEDPPTRDFRSWEADFSALDIRDRVVIMLLFKQVVQIDEVEAAWRRFQGTNQGRSREPLWRILARDPAFDRNRILEEAARSAGYERTSINPASAAAFIDAHFTSFSERDWERMLTLNVVPIGKEDDPRTGRGRYVFVSPDPTRPGISNLLRDLKLGGHVLRFAPEHVIDSLLADLTGRSKADAPSKELEVTPPSVEDNNTLENSLSDPSESPDTPEAADDHSTAEAEAEAVAEVQEPDPTDAASEGSAEARELLDACLVEAVEQEASGVHLLPIDDGLQIDMRIDGELERWKTCARGLGDDLLAIVKEEALNVKPSEIDSVQDGLIRRAIGESTVRFRVSILPIAGSFSEDRRESIVITMLGDDAAASTLDGLGLPDETLAKLRMAIAEPRGMVVLAGPSGSGRGTTLNAILNEIVTPKVNVITLEESVTHEVQGVRQVRLNNKLDHEDALEAVRRHDPDVILVGELRTKETAELALKLANAGHLVFSRLPAHDTTGAVGRLFRLGVDPFLIAYAINLVVAQRLMRRLCPDCKQPAKHIDGELLRRLGFSRQEIASTTFYDEGDAECPTCRDRRYDGSQIIAEAMPFAHDTRRLIALADAALDDEDVRAHAVREGMTTIRSSAREIVLRGETSVGELIRVTAGES